LSTWFLKRVSIFRASFNIPSQYYCDQSLLPAGTLPAFSVSYCPIYFTLCVSLLCGWWTG